MGQNESKAEQNDKSSLSCSLKRHEPLRRATFVSGGVGGGYPHAAYQIEYNRRARYTKRRKKKKEPLQNDANQQLMSNASEKSSYGTILETENDTKERKDSAAQSLIRYAAGEPSARSESIKQVDQVTKSQSWEIIADDADGYVPVRDGVLHVCNEGVFAVASVGDTWTKNGAESAQQSHDNSTSKLLIGQAAHSEKAIRDVDEVDNILSGSSFEQRVNLHSQNPPCHSNAEVVHEGYHKSKHSLSLVDRDVTEFHILNRASKRSNSLKNGCILNDGVSSTLCRDLIAQQSSGSPHLENTLSDDASKYHRTLDRASDQPEHTSVCVNNNSKNLTCLKSIDDSADSQQTLSKESLINLNGTDKTPCDNLPEAKNCQNPTSDHSVAICDPMPVGNSSKDVQLKPEGIVKVLAANLPGFAKNYNDIVNNSVYCNSLLESRNHKEIASPGSQTPATNLLPGIDDSVSADCLSEDNAQKIEDSEKLSTVNLPNGSNVEKGFQNFNQQPPTAETFCATGPEPAFVSCKINPPILKDALSTTVADQSDEEAKCERKVSMCHYIHPVAEDCNSSDDRAPNSSSNHSSVKNQRRVFSGQEFVNCAQSTAIVDPSNVEDCEAVLDSNFSEAFDHNQIRSSGNNSSQSIDVISDHQISTTNSVDISDDLEPNSSHSASNQSGEDDHNRVSSPEDSSAVNLSQRTSATVVQGNELASNRFGSPAHPSNISTDHSVQSIMFDDAGLNSSSCHSEPKRVECGIVSVISPENESGNPGNPDSDVLTETGGLLGITDDLVPINSISGLTDPADRPKKHLTLPDTLSNVEKDTCNLPVEGAPDQNFENLSAESDLSREPIHCQDYYSKDYQGHSLISDSAVKKSSVHPPNDGKDCIFEEDAESGDVSPKSAFPISDTDFSHKSKYLCSNINVPLDSSKGDSTVPSGSLQAIKDSSVNEAGSAIDKKNNGPISPHEMSDKDHNATDITVSFTASNLAAQSLDLIKNHETKMLSKFNSDIKIMDLNDNSALLSTDLELSPNEETVLCDNKDPTLKTDNIWCADPVHESSEPKSFVRVRDYETPKKDSELQILSCLPRLRSQTEVSSASDEYWSCDSGSESTTNLCTVIRDHFTELGDFSDDDVVPPCDLVWDHSSDLYISDMSCNLPDVVYSSQVSNALDWAYSSVETTLSDGQFSELSDLSVDDDIESLPPPESPKIHVQVLEEMLMMKNFTEDKYSPVVNNQKMALTYQNNIFEPMLSRSSI